MTAKRATTAPKSRELRRRVTLSARMRAGATWRDACILNVSSRGLMINAPAATSAATGSMIELRHGDHVIIATVVWSSGTRAGLRSERRLPVDELLALGSAAAIQPVSGQWPGVERRRRARGHDQNRLRGRAVEFAGVAIVAVSLGLGIIASVEQGFAGPMAKVSAALGR